MKESYLKPTTEVISNKPLLFATQSFDIEVSEDDDRTIQTADIYTWDDDFAVTSWDEDTNNDNVNN